jgi:stage V sporulation protein R
MTYIWTEADWTFPLIRNVYDEIEKIAIDELGLNPYRNELEIISSEQMLDAYSSIGMPVMYKHWSFGKHFTKDKKLYDKGHQGLAYEIVINSDPCIAYLMEENTMTMQALVIAHAAFGHNHFFKNNQLFKTWTDASSIIDYLVFARNFIAKCEEKEGEAEVERFLDSCHALMNYGVNRYKKPSHLSLDKEKKRQERRDEDKRLEVHALYDRLIKKAEKEKDENFPKEPEENILYFCEKYAPDLPEWKREIIRIVRKIAQYFYPQGQTKTMNEGTATYVHYTILNRLHDKGLMTDGSMIEFLKSHTNVVFQPTFDDPRYSGINPYALGFAMMQDIERICKNPTEEDRRWFPAFAGANENHMTILKDAWENYRDESFVRQFLSPKVIRDFKMFKIRDNLKEAEMKVTAIHNDQGYQDVRDALGNNYEQNNYYPRVEVTKMEPKTRALHLTYYPYRGRTLFNATAMMAHVRNLWGYSVTLWDTKGNVLV